MKKITLFFCTTLICFAEPSVDSLMTQEQREELERTQSLINNLESQRSGESMFANKASMENKDRLIKDNFSIAQNDESYQNPNYQNAQYTQYQQMPQEITEEQLLLMKQALRNKNLRAVQKKFLDKKYTGFENATQLLYEENKTHKIRTRFTMATTIIFESAVESYILGDQSGYKVEEIPNMPNALSVKPFLIGIDTNLTIFTKDKKIHNFFLYSTDYKSKELPNLLVKILDDESKILTQKQMEEEAKKYFVIQEGIAKIKVEREKMDFSYKMKAKKENEWLIPSEVFNDETWTYFKYEKKRNNKIPSVFAVIDSYDNPVETKIIGDYIIAETRNNQWTIWSGNSYVCIEKEQTAEPKKAESQTKPLANPAKTIQVIDKTHQELLKAKQ